MKLPYFLIKREPREKDNLKDHSKSQNSYVFSSFFCRSLHTKNKRRAKKEEKQEGREREQKFHIFTGNEGTSHRELLRGFFLLSASGDQAGCHSNVPLFLINVHWKNWLSSSDMNTQKQERIYGHSILKIG